MSGDQPSIAVDAPFDAGDARSLAVGARLGRYVVVGKLGTGNTGAVYAAFDPVLDRKVALRVLVRTSPGQAEADDGLDAPGSGSRAWLLRESQALARLAHPNVVAVHDVGTVPLGVFIAMELVEGQTLSDWVGSAPRRPREVLDAFIAAGRGLVAAQGEGLMHLDFRPEKVLVGRDGRVQVADFGWAHAEPLAGGASDAQRAQLSFCTALYRALWRADPFPESGGASAKPPPRSGIPAGVRLAIQRGLSVNPADRHASMAALLGELGRLPWATRSRVAIGTLMVALLAVSASLWLRAPRKSDCGDTARQLSGVWDDGVERRLRETFLRTNLDYAQGTFERTAAALRGYASALAEQQRRTCEAKRAGRGTLLAEREERCLARRKSQLAALTQQLTLRPDPVVLQNAVEAARGLESLEACADERALARGVAPPHEPRLRAQVEALEARVDAVDTLHRTGKYAEGLRRAEALAGEVAGLKWDPLRVKLRLLTAKLQQKVGDHVSAERGLREVIPAAARLGEENLVAEAWSSLLHVVGGNSHRPEEALLFRPALASAVVRAADPAIEALAARTVAQALEMASQPSEALAVAAKALKMAEAAFDPDDLRLASALDVLGNVLDSSGRAQESVEMHTRALSIRQRALGAGHPTVGASYHNLGLDFRTLGRSTEARDHLERARVIWEQALGPTHPRVVLCLTNLGLVSMDLGRAEEAVAYEQRGLDLHRRAFGAEHPLVADSLTALGAALREAGRLAESRAAYEEGFATYTRTVRPESRSLDFARMGLGLTEAHLGHHGRARALLSQALDRVEKVDGPESALAGELRCHQAMVEHLAGEFAEAQALLERALPRVSPLERPACQFRMAQVLWHRASDRSRALLVAAEALRGYELRGNVTRVAEVTQWLEQRSPRRSAR